MTRDEAIALAKTEWWDGLTTRQVVAFQLFEDKLCMPFGIYHAAVEDVLDRPVFTHEFAFAAEPGGLREEFLRVAPRRSLQEILRLIPAEKRMVVIS